MTRQSERSTALGGPCVALITSFYITYLRRKPGNFFVFSSMSGSVFLYVPNLIGYVRVFLAVVAVVYAFDNYKLTVAAYTASQLLDALDGYAARALEQSSVFGAVLDMVTDRISSNILLMILAIQSGKSGYLLYAGLAALDYASHWYSMYASVFVGAASHKAMTPSRPWLLRIYYGSKVFLFLCCVSQELTYLALFVIQSTEGLAAEVAYNSFAHAALLASAPLTVLKQVINVVQLADAVNTVSSRPLFRVLNQ